jgi:hypothetical protein
MKNYAFHLAQGDISICIMRMAMVTPALAPGASVGTIGKADVYFMVVILGRGGCFVNGGFWFHALSDKKKNQHQDRCAEAPQVLFGKSLLNKGKDRSQIQQDQKEERQQNTALFLHQRPHDPHDWDDIRDLVIRPKIDRAHKTNRDD